MKVLLLSTLPNQVHHALSEASEAEVTVIDFSKGISRTALLAKISALLRERSFDVLLTYRCPYIIPREIFEQFPVAFNIHPLPLPEFSGLNPWDAFLSSGHTNGEAVLHRMTSQPDDGEIIATEPFTFTSPSDARAAADRAASRLIPFALGN